MPKIKYRQKVIYKNRIFYTNTERKVDNIEKKLIFFMKKYTFVTSEIQNMSSYIRKLPEIENKCIEMLVVCLKFITKRKKGNFIDFFIEEIEMLYTDYDPVYLKNYLYSMFRYINYLNKYL